MKKPPLFSVVIPTFNREMRIAKAIESVLSQTCTDFELIVVDDGSTDGTKEVMRKFDSSKVCYHWQEASGGPAKPRNTGIKMATGKYVAFLDSDDWWLPDKLHVCWKYIEKYPDIDVFYHDIRYFTNGIEGEIRKSGDVRVPMLRHLLEHNSGIPTSGSIVRREIFNVAGEFDEDKRYVSVEDFEMWLRLSLHTERFMRIDQALGCINVHAANLTSTSDMQLQNAERVYEKYVKICTGNSLEQKRLMGFNYFCSALRYHRMGRKDDAQRYYLKAISSGRLDWKPFAGLIALSVGVTV